MTNKRYRKHGMNRFKASAWQVIKSYIEWYAVDIYDGIMSAFGLIGIVAVIFFGALFFT